MTLGKETSAGREWLPKLAIIFFINLCLLSAVYFGFEHIYKNKIYPGVYVGRIDLNGKTSDEAKALVNAQISKINSDGIDFSIEQQKTTIYPITLSPNNITTLDLIIFDTDDTIKQAMGLGRNDGFLTNFKNKIYGLIFKYTQPVAYSLDEEKTKDILRNIFSTLETPSKNAEIIYQPSPKEKIEISQEKTGWMIDYDKGINILKNRLNILDNSPIGLAKEINYPDILKKDCLNIEKKAEYFLAKAPLILKNEDKKWTVNKADIASWLSLELNPDYNASSDQQNKIIVAINSEAAKKFLQDKIGSQINKNPINAKFQIINGRIAEFQAQNNGQEIDLDATLKAINSEFFSGDKKEITLVVNEIKSDIGLSEVNNLGLTEIIATGESNFAGSPKNRRHNIKTGADAVNGSLVKPGEEFSLIKILKAGGDIGPSTGYLPELVIKQGKTIPEFGGGLCQIGTTIFRAALASGLPITERRNHSYRVVYYEPAGTDATIYDPWPDFRFINDTKNYILVQSRIKGNSLYFDVWGTKDGRITEQTKSTIYNIVKPKPAKIIETLDLKPGEKKCSEKAHNGADAYFDYKVTYPNGEIKEKRFSSHYVPWQEVCLLGVKEFSASSTPQIAGSTASSSATSTR